MDYEIRVEGVDELMGRLREMDDKLRTKAMRASLRAAALPMQAAVQERAPVKVEAGGRLPDGALKSDVVLRVTQKDGLPVALIQFGKLTYFVARWVEYGHRLVKGGNSSMKRGKLQGRGHQIGEVPAHPFIRPAFEATWRASCDAFVRELRAQLFGRR